MTNLDDLPTLWDEWQQLRNLFLSNNDDRFFEVAFDNVEADNMFLCLQDLLDQSSNFSSFFVQVESRAPVHVPSLMSLIVGVQSDNIAGAVGITLPTLPMLTLYFDEPRRLSLAYTPSSQWSPIAITAFLLLLHDLSRSLQSSDISLSSVALTHAQMTAFSQILTNYV